MPIMSDVSEADVRAPFFDAPQRPGDVQPPVGMGTRVVLVLQGAEVSAEIMAIERLGTVFVGRVVKISPDGARPDDVAPGDFVRFRLRDVHGVE